MTNTTPKPQQSRASMRSNCSLACKFASLMLCLNASTSNAFVTPNPAKSMLIDKVGSLTSSPASSATALNVWWFGGTESSELTDSNADSCELVAVRIDRTSPNSRRIAGEITVPTRLTDVWAIITDYNRLSTHVPNLVESKIVGRSQGVPGEQGDGSYRCKLYQKGAQKIVGFDFSASVTMDMTEEILKTTSFAAANNMQQINSDDNEEEEIDVQPMLMYDRRVGFKCADSFFFNEFDGDWIMKEQYNDLGEIETVLKYIVDVRPKGPVPVAALEWQIQQEVPTNLRAVKKAATEVGEQGVLEYRQQQQQPKPDAVRNNGVRRISLQKVDRAMQQRNKVAVESNGEVQVLEPQRTVPSSRQPVPVPVAMAGATQILERQLDTWDQWDRDETMAAYLTE